MPHRNPSFPFFATKWTSCLAMVMSHISFCYYYRLYILFHAIEYYFILLIKIVAMARLVSSHEIFAVQTPHVHRLEFLVHVYKGIVSPGRIMTRNPTRNIRSLSFYLSSDRCVFDIVTAWAEETMIKNQFFFFLLRSIISTFSPLLCYHHCS